ncbi:MAG TPA: class I SAM-dependent methyltransferase [Terriglobales bacterium]|nr:class I SAM-dependent methyltransferase [Terriglobales bacterium]
MSEQQYFHGDLVALYDTLNPLGADSDYFIAACEPAPQTILDLGCGTGLLTKALAQRGHQVTGVDPAPAMLEIARHPPLLNAQWLCADARELDLGIRFDRVIASGHVFQVFLTAADRLAFLRTAARHLKPQGRLIFDSRNPAAATWLGWTPARSKRRIVHTTHGLIDIWHEVGSVDGERVKFTSSYHFGESGQTYTNAGELAFPPYQLIREQLGAAGLQVIKIDGDWSGAPFTTAAPEIIVTAGPGDAGL